MSGQDELVDWMMTTDPGTDRALVAEHVQGLAAADVEAALQRQNKQAFDAFVNPTAGPASTPMCAAEFDATVAPEAAGRVPLGPFGVAKELDPAVVDPRDRVILDGPEPSATAERAEALAELAAAGADPAELAEGARSMVGVAGQAVVETDALAARAGEQVMSDVATRQEAIAYYNAEADRLAQLAADNPDRAAALNAAASCMRNFGAAAIPADTAPRAGRSASTSRSAAPRVSNAKRLQAPAPRTRQR